MKKELYIRLKEVREKKGLSQADVANALNLSRQAISQWETGKAYPDIDNLVLLCELYDMTLDELVGRNSKTLFAEEQEIQKEVIAKESENKEINHDLQSVLEMMCMAVILMLSSQIAFLGVVIPIVVIIWMKKKQKKYKMIYLLCIFCWFIGVYNTYVILSYYVFEQGTYTIEPI